MTALLGGLFCVAIGFIFGSCASKTPTGTEDIQDRRDNG